MAVSVLLDQKYDEAVASNGPADRLLIAARKNILQEFMLRMRPSPSDHILDVGVSDVVNDGANVLERMYPHQAMIAVCGLGEGREFPNTYSEARYIKITANAALPFGDRSFEIATSNAVLEHVGSAENQMLFVAELSRVAKRVFITVEHHTAIPLPIGKPMFSAPHAG
jgi:hypothetical protein